jgi:hypothetical protein
VSPPRREPVTCGHCGQQQKCSRTVLEQPVCQVCQLRFACDPKPCPGCGVTKVLAFYDAERRPACAGCTGNHPVYACDQCGREDSHWGRRCAPCVLTERLTALLSQPGAGIHPRLQPIFDVLICGPRPQTTLYWLDRSTGPATLAAMARGEVEISHAAFQAMPVNKTNTYLRDLLAAVGVLPPFHAEFERITPRLNELLAALPAEQADLLTRFARWHLMRRMRHQEQAGTLTHGSVSAARATLVATTRFMHWQTRRRRPIHATTQDDLDRYSQAHRSQAVALAPFLAWAENAGTITPGLSLPTNRTGQPALTLSDHDRWAQVDLLLHDDTIRLHTRVAGLFLLLYAQPLARICRMRTAQVRENTDRPLTVTFDTFPVELPQPLDQLVCEQLTRRGQASYVSRPDYWLFPGGIPGKHLVTENIRTQLAERGIQPRASRNAAMFQLAAEIPTPILADILGLGATTATSWAALASRDWSQYTAQRANLTPL